MPLYLLSILIVHKTLYKFICPFPALFFVWQLFWEITPQVARVHLIELQQQPYIIPNENSTMMSSLAAFFMIYDLREASTITSDIYQRSNIVFYIPLLWNGTNSLSTMGHHVYEIENAYVLIILD